MADDPLLLDAALRAFDLFTHAEKLHALKVFAELEYPRIEDRFEEAVYQVVVSRDGEGE